MLQFDIKLAQILSNSSFQSRVLTHVADDGNGLLNDKSRRGGKYQCAVKGEDSYDYCYYPICLVANLP